MLGEAGIIVAALAGVCGIAALRLSWGRAERSVPLNAVGWGLIGAGLVAGWIRAGAWGMTVAMLWATAAALVLLAVAAWRDPAVPAKGSNRRAGMLAEPGEPRHLARRIATSAIVTVGGLATAIALGIVARWAATAASASEADANVLAFFAVPLVWSILAFVLLMTQDRKRQIAIIALPIIAALPALAEGSMS